MSVYVTVFTLGVDLVVVVVDDSDSLVDSVVGDVVVLLDSVVVGSVAVLVDLYVVVVVVVDFDSAFVDLVGVNFVENLLNNVFFWKLLTLLIEMKGNARKSLGLFDRRHRCHLH